METFVTMITPLQAWRYRCWLSPWWWDWRSRKSRQFKGNTFKGKKNFKDATVQCATFRLYYLANQWQTNEHSSYRQYIVHHICNVINSDDFPKLILKSKVLFNLEEGKYIRGFKFAHWADSIYLMKMRPVDFGDITWGLQELWLVNCGCLCFLCVEIADGEDYYWTPSKFRIYCMSSPYQ